jgi:hypothetical protein
VVNSGGLIGTQPFTLTVPPAGQLPSFVGATSATFSAGRSNSFAIGLNPGSGTLKLTELGALPAGVKLKLSWNGAVMLSGTPSLKSAGRYVFSPIVTNGAGRVSETFTLTVSRPLAITAKNSAKFTVGQTGSVAISSTGYPPAGQ